MNKKFYLGALACLWACTNDNGNNDDSNVTDDSGTQRDDTGNNNDDTGKNNDDTGKTDDTGGTDDTGKEETISARLELVVDGLTAPVNLATLPWDKGHLYIVDQPGRVYRIDPSASKVELGKPWADLTSIIGDLDPKYDERGLLSMAGSSDAGMEGRVYFFHTIPASDWPTLPSGYDHENVVAEYTATKDALDVTSGSIKWSDDHPYMNHNGGSILFGDDGYLYISLGDGGNKNDIGLGHSEPLGNGQDRTNQEGSILRIQVGPKILGYDIPSDNPLVGLDCAAEIWAYGFRNPSTISFDRSTGQLWATDAGQSMMEEVDLVTKGQNYGWNIKEGTLCFNEDDELSPLDTCADTDSYGVKLTDPILTFTNAASPKVDKAEGPVGTVIVGGATYRGSNVPDLQAGDFIFGSYSGDFEGTFGSLFVGRADSSSSTGWKLYPLDLGTATTGHFVLHVAADDNGEIYVLVNDMGTPSGSTGAVYRLVASK
jgi:glucose/arabinose dehydrogenase